MRKRKVLLSIVLVLTLVINLVSWGSIRPALATEEMTTEASTEPISSEDIESSTKVQENTEEEKTSETTTAESTTEDSSYVILEDEDGNEFIAITTEDITESSESGSTASDDATTEKTTEVATTEASTVEPTISEEFVELEDEVDGKAGDTKDWSNPKYWTEDEKRSVTTHNVKNSNGADVRWGGGHLYWYATGNYGGLSKIIFCLENGATMNQNTKLSFKDINKMGKVQSVRINTAVNYYIKQAGSLDYDKFNAEAYRIAQYAIWGDGDTSSSSSEVKTAGYLQVLATKGEALFKGSKGSSYARNVEKIKGHTSEGISNIKSAVSSNSYTKTLKINKRDSVYKKNGKKYNYSVTLNPSNDNANWKYFCRGGSLDGNSPGGYGDITASVTKGAGWKGGDVFVNIKTSGDDCGKVTVYCENDPDGTQAAIIFTLKGSSDANTILGSTSAFRLYSASAPSWQNMSNSHPKMIGYWATVITNQTVDKEDDSHEFWPTFQLYKKSDNGKVLNDCSFKLTCPNGAIHDVDNTTSTTDFQDIFMESGIGTYTIQETETVDGHAIVKDTASFVVALYAHHQYKYTTIDGTTYDPVDDYFYGISVPVVNDIDGDPSNNGNIVCSSNYQYGSMISENYGYDDNGYVIPVTNTELTTDATYGQTWASTYVTFTNERITGDAEILKLADKLTEFVKSPTGVETSKDENGNIKYGGFKYELLPLQGPTFNLFAYSDIIVDGDTLFKKDNPILPNTKWCTHANCTEHTITYDKATDATGKIVAKNLPIGTYYFTEETTDKKYVVNTNKHVFTMVQDFDDANQNGITAELIPDYYTKGSSENLTIVNYPIYANPKVYKANAATGERLAGAEFTLYAKGTNLNYDDKPLFTEDDCVEAVVSRNLEKGTEEKEGGWVPIETAVSNADGEAFFGLVPYGDYLVVETKAPYGYTLPEDSWKFTHSKGQTATQDMYSNGVDYSHGFVFGNKEKTVEVVVNKTGSVVTGSEEVTTDYGTYKKLKVEQRPLAGVLFNVLDEKGAIVDSIITNAEGTAKADGLMPGLYYVQEVNNGDPMLKLDETKYEVDLRLDEHGNVDATKSINCVNELVTTQLALYKNGEKAYITNEVLNNPEQFTGVTVLDENSAFSYDVEPLGGAVFGIYAKADMKNSEGAVVINAGDCVGYTVSDDFGKASLSELLLPGEYSYKEIIAPESYKLDGNEYTFTLLADGSDKDIQINPTTPLINTLTKSSIRLVKQDMDTEEVLEGVEFELYNQDNVLIGAYVTDENGEINVIDLPLGKYYFVETEPLDGYYEFTDKVEYELTDDGYLYTIIAYNEEIPDKPKLGTVEALDIFCGVLLFGCLIGLGFIWIPRRKED